MSEREGVRDKVHVCVCVETLCGVCVRERGKRKGGKIFDVRARYRRRRCVEGFFSFSLSWRHGAVVCRMKEKGTGR